MMRMIQSLIWLLLICGLFSLPVSHAKDAADHSADEVARSAESQAYYDQIQSILLQKAFGEKEIVKRWRIKEQKEDEKKEESAFLKWLRDLLRGSGDRDAAGGAVSVAKGLEVLLWALVIGLILFLVVKYRTQLKELLTGAGVAEASDLPSTMFGLDVKKTSMPEDVVGSAQALWQSGETRQSIALLLRASLIKLLHEHQCVFYDSDTEAECCARIKQHVSPKLSQYMHSLVQVWQQVAYGHKKLPKEMFDTLCRQWQEVF